MVGYCQTVDSFDPEPNDQVYAIAVQPDGKIVVGGLFGELNNSVHGCVGRLNASSEAA